MTRTIEDVEWVEVQATAHVHDWQINEIRQVNLKDGEARALVTAGLFVIVDEETRKLLPPPVRSIGSPGGGCGCG